jgi:dihydroorotate dehydrogenase (fumarate)
MDLSTTYLGLKLRNPLVPGASPLTQNVDNVKRMEDAGAGAVVFHSLFEEQILMENKEFEKHMQQTSDVSAEATSYFPQLAEFHVGPEEYLEHLSKAKQSVKIPVIASINASSPGGWEEYAKKVQQTGVDALELNIYYIPTDPKLSAKKVDDKYVEILGAVKAAVTIPVAVKLSPFFSNTANIAKRLKRAGADGLVLFNRFYQPDLDLEKLEVEHKAALSSSSSMRVPMRWIAILHGRVKLDYAASGGIHTATDVIKMMMVGANVTMLCSTLLVKGIGELKLLEQGMRDWMERHEYKSVKQLRGIMSQKKVADPSAYERAHYMKVLQGYQA